MLTYRAGDAGVVGGVTVPLAFCVHETDFQGLGFPRNRKRAKNRMDREAGKIMANPFAEQSTPKKTN